MPLKRLRVNVHFVIAWMSKNFFLEKDAICEIKVNAVGFKPATTYFVNELSHLAKRVNG